MILKVKPEHMATVTKQKIDDLVAHIQINAPDFYQRMQDSEENGISMIEALYRYQRYIEDGANAEETIFMFFNEWKRSNPEELDATYRMKGMASQADLNRVPFLTKKSEVSMLAVFQALVHPEVVVCNVGQDREHIGTVVVRSK